MLNPITFLRPCFKFLHKFGHWISVLIPEGSSQANLPHSFFGRPMVLLYHRILKRKRLAWNPGVWNAHSKFIAWRTPPNPMCLCHGSLTCVYRLIYMTTAVQEGAFSLLVSFDRLLSGSHLLNYSPCPYSAGAQKIYHKDLPIIHSASNSSVVSTERNVKLSKMSYSFLCPSLCQDLHPFYSNHSLPQMLWQ